MKKKLRNESNFFFLPFAKITDYVRHEKKT